nr:hypothetical protein [uncultured Methanoregula sp.]
MSGCSRVDGERDVLKFGDDILVVGCAITASKDFGHAAEKFIGKRNQDESERFGI